LIFRDDLTVIDRQTIMAMEPSTPFLWAVHPKGTWLLRLDAPGAISWAAAIRHGGQTLHWFLWTGIDLVSIPPVNVERILHSCLAVADRSAQDLQVNDLVEVEGAVHHVRQIATGRTGGIPRFHLAPTPLQGGHSAPTPRVDGSFRTLVPIRPDGRPLCLPVFCLTN
jgi:hypothetical protein